MPSTTFNVSGASLPREAEGANSPHRDEVLDGLLAFFAHCIRVAVGSKVSEQQGPVTSARVDDACPATNLFPWAHNGTFMRPHRRPGLPPEALPGLWLWVESGEGTQEGATLWHREVVAWTLRADYIFPEVSIPDGYGARSGLLRDVERAVLKACSTRSHPTFTPSGGALGSAVLTPLRLLGLRFDSAKESPQAVQPGATAQSGNRPAGEGAQQRFFPCLSLSLRTWARVGDWEPSFPADVLQDSFLVVNTGDNTADTVEILERVLPPPVELADP